MIVETLQLRCLRMIVKRSEWMQLSPHIQRCLTPVQIAIPLGRFQRDILSRRKQRMEVIVQLLTELLSFNLIPKRAVRVDIAIALRTIIPGEHLVVMCGGRQGYAHHGIYIGFIDGRDVVIDFSSPTGDAKMCDGCIRIRSYSDFLKGHTCLYVVPYDCEEEDKAKYNALQLAKSFADRPVSDVFHCYDLVRWNCEAFVLTCKTGQYQASEQVKSMFKAIQKDIFSQHSKLCGVVSIGVRASSGCSVQ